MHKQQKTCLHVVVVNKREGDVLLGIFVGMCGLVLQTLTLFQTKICSFWNPFPDEASKIHTNRYGF